MKSFMPHAAWMSALFLSASFLSACGSTTSVTNGSGSGSQTSAVATATPNNLNTQGLPTAPTTSFYVSGSGGPTVAYNGATYSPSDSFTETPIGANLSTETPLLRVNVSPLYGGPVLNGGFLGFYPVIGCASFTVNVNGTPYSTVALAVQGQSASSACPNAPTSQTIDMSASISSYSSTTPITISVQADEDDNCWSNSNLGVNNFGCPMSATPSIHSIVGSIQIQVNGYYMP